MKPTFNPQTFLSHLTTEAGVYQMYDAAGKILYVGKAKNLKNRLSSYFQKTGLNPKTQALVSRIQSINITVTPSETEALVLEQNLIKSQHPPYNILMRDDKSYPYILLTEGEPYPRLDFHRGAKQVQGRYFGPYPNGKAARESLQFLQRTFKVRQCKDSVFNHRTRPCLQHQIGRCTAPCVGLITPEAYGQDVHKTRLFLNGQDQALIKDISTAMEAAAEALEFEQAAQLRDQITALRAVQSTSAIEGGQANVDIIACAQAFGAVVIHLLYVRQGRLLGSKSYYPKNILEESLQTLLEQFVAQQYLLDRGMDLPDSVILELSLSETPTLIEAIKTQKGHRIAFLHNVKGIKNKWLAMAQQAAEHNLKSHLNSQQTSQAKLQALQQLLQLPQPPQRMECFDISHSSGEATRASCVVFVDGVAHKKDYRRFSIEGIAQGDDYAAMHQALTRRLSRLQQEEKPLPSLLIVDGGKGQLSQAQQVLCELHLNIPLLGIAKGSTRKAGFETLILPNGAEKTLSDDHPALHLLQQIRDEAHRFAITGHKNARDKTRRQSRLETIPGVGPKRRRELLLHFGGLQEILKANPDDLAKVPSFNKKLAQAVYTALHCE